MNYFLSSLQQPAAGGSRWQRRTQLLLMSPSRRQVFNFLTWLFAAAAPLPLSPLDAAGDARSLLTAVRCRFKRSGPSRALQVGDAASDERERRA